MIYCELSLIETGSLRQQMKVIQQLQLKHLSKRFNDKTRHLRYQSYIEGLRRFWNEKFVCFRLKKFCFWLRNWNFYLWNVWNMVWNYIKLDQYSLQCLHVLTQNILIAWVFALSLLKSFNSCNRNLIFNQFLACLWQNFN